MSSLDERQRQAAPASPAGFDIETLVGFILLGGVLLSLALVTAGLGWRWVVTGHLGFEYSIARVNLFEFLVRNGRQVAADDIRPRHLVNLGLAALMLTPYARVLASMLYFAVQRNRKYTAFTAFVLGVLTYSLFIR